MIWFSFANSLSGSAMGSSVLDSITIPTPGRPIRRQSDPVQLLFITRTSNVEYLESEQKY
jgi:hypothetical protein